MPVAYNIPVAGAWVLRVRSLAIEPVDLQEERAHRMYVLTPVANAHRGYTLSPSALLWVAPPVVVIVGSLSILSYFVPSPIGLDSLLSVPNSESASLEAAARLKMIGMMTLVVMLAISLLIYSVFDAA